MADAGLPPDPKFAGEDDPGTLPPAGDADQGSPHPSREGDELPPPGGLPAIDAGDGFAGGGGFGWDDDPYDVNRPMDEVIDVDVPPDRFGRGRVRKSQRPSIQYAETPTITRLHMLQFISEKEWWYSGQNALGFTLVLWFIFMFIMYTRAGVTQSYDLHLSVAQHMENIIAHPHLSGIRTRAVEDDPMPCRCACQSSSAGMPKGPCDPAASETLDFLGLLNASSPRLTQFNMAALLTAEIDPSVLGDKLEAGNDDIVPMTWDRISTAEDVWFWIEHGFIPDVWRARSQEAGNATLQGLVAQKNLIIGGVRARQTRAQWSAICEDKISSELSSFYRTPCRSSEAGTGSYGPTFSPNSSLNQGQYYGFQAFQPSTSADIGDATGYYDGLFDIEFDITNALDTATVCRKGHWVDAATREVRLQSVTLNAEIGMFAIIDIVFNFPVGGGVEKKVKVHTIHAVGSKIDFLDILPELCWAGMIVLLLRQEIFQMCMAGWHRKCLDYWLDLWCVVDWVSIFVGILITIFWVWQMSSIGEISDSVAALPRAPFASGANSTGLNEMPADLNKYHTQWLEILDGAIYVFERKVWYQLCLFWYTLILTGRFLKGFLSQAKLAMLQLTVGTTFWDLSHLLVFFATLFLNFQLGGHILFGSELKEWSTMVEAGGTSVQMMLGNYLFEPMYEIAPVSATCWFWGFLFTMSFILMNLIFAMVADYFHVIRRAIGATDSLFEEIKNAFAELWWRWGWRKINLEDGEYKMAFIEYPYSDELIPGLMELCEAPKSMERDADHTCLGVRLGRRHLEAGSIEGLNAKIHKGFEECTSKAIQEYDTDIMAADHLLELIFPKVVNEYAAKGQTQLTMIRHFVQLLRNHHKEMDAHCQSLEAEVTGDHSNLTKSLDYLEVNVRVCLKEFERLKEDGVHSLAPPMMALPRPGTLAANEAQNQSLVAPGALLRAIEQSEIAQKSPKKTNGPPQPPVPPVRGNNVANAMLMNSSNAAVMALKDGPEVVNMPQQQGNMLELQDVGGSSPDNKRGMQKRGAVGGIMTNEGGMSNVSPPSTAPDPPPPPQPALTDGEPEQPQQAALEDGRET